VLRLINTRLKKRGGSDGEREREGRKGKAERVMRERNRGREKGNIVRLLPHI